MRANGSTSFQAARKDREVLAEDRGDKVREEEVHNNVKRKFFESSFLNLAQVKIAFSTLGKVVGRAGPKVYPKKGLKMQSVCVTRRSNIYCATGKMLAIRLIST